MIVLAGLIHLPLRVVAVFGVALIALHNMLDRFHVQGWQGPGTAVPSYGAKLFIILHQANEPFPIVGWPSPTVFVLYPLVPWIGVMAAGYAFGVIYKWDTARRRRLLLRSGSAMTVLFIVIRAINHVRRSLPGRRQSTRIFTYFSFLNTTKYLPSLLF